MHKALRDVQALSSLLDPYTATQLARLAEAAGYQAETLADQQSNSMRAMFKQLDDLSKKK